MALSKRVTRFFKGRSVLSISSKPLMSEATTTPTQQKHREAVLYIHWPYCSKRCTYCNFNKYVSEFVDNQRMTKCLALETKTLLELGQISKIKTVFFGGGTPSLALPSTISKVLNTVKDHVDFNENSEVTLEANPTNLTMDRLREFKDAGINRLSLGIQALNDKDLKTLGRDHSAEQALRCLEKAKDIFQDRVSIDLMFGRPGQTVDQWNKELKKVVEVCDKQVSLYQLTLEKGTPIYKWVQSGKCTLPDDDSMADMYSLAVEVLAKHGLQQYEVSNFAEKGFETKHNQAYWNGEDYIGVGPGAHGRFTPVYNTEKEAEMREERIQALQPDNWMYEVEHCGHGTKKIVPQTKHNRLKELIMLSLRTKHGLSSQRWSSLCPHIDLLTLFGSSERVQALCQNNFLVLDECGMHATSKGIAVVDGIIPSLLVELENEFLNTCNLYD